MNGEEKSQVLGAADALKLRDIQLFEARFERPTKAIETGNVQARQEHMRGVAYVIGDVDLEGQTHRLLQITVHLGTRVVEERTEPDPPVYFLIEASFLVEYEVTGLLEDDAIAAFANYNAVHNAWPFWRQHVYDIVQRGRLPPLEIPLFSGIKT